MNKTAGTKGGATRKSPPPARGRSREVTPKVPLEYVLPMKPILVDTLPTDPTGWLYEIKFDGFRVIALKTGASVELWSAAHKPLLFPAVAAAVAELPCEDAILDGEIVAVDAQGRSSFQLLQNSREDQAGAPICLYLFDLLHLDGVDLRAQDTVTRKARLGALLARGPHNDRLRLSADLAGDPAHIMDAVQRLGLEGVVAKRRDAAYHTGVRSPNWHKVKLATEQDFVIGGFTRPEGTRRYFGALLVGYYRGGKLQYAARVGTGFDMAALARLHGTFLPLRQETCPFVNLPAREAGRWGQGITPAKMKLCTWIKPTLVSRVKFAQWTDDGALRHPVFLGLRNDRVPRQVEREAPLG